MFSSHYNNRRVHRSGLTKQSPVALTAREHVSISLRHTESCHHHLIKYNLVGRRRRIVRILNTNSIVSRYYDVAKLAAMTLKDLLALSTENDELIPARTQCVRWLL